MKLKIAALLVASSSLSFGALYTLNSGTGATASGIVDLQGRAFRGGTTLGDAFTGASGGISGGPGVVGFGIFSTEDFGTLSASQIVAAYTGFGTSGPFAIAGATGNRSIYSSAQGGTITGSAYAGKSFYLFAGNGTTFENSTQFLIVKANTFTFNAADDSNSLPIVQTIRPDNSTVLFGSVLPDVKTASTDNSVTPGWQMAAPIPEPSAALLGAIGALGLLRRRRN